MKPKYLLIGLLVAGCSQATQPNDIKQTPTTNDALTVTMEACLEQYVDAKIVRKDDVNQRFFMVGTTAVIDGLAQSASEINSCFKGGAWDDKWSISLFSSSEFAGYADEPEIIQLHENDLWSKAYLAEFDGASGVLTKNPTTAPEQILPKP